MSGHEDVAAWKASSDECTMRYTYHYPTFWAIIELYASKRVDDWILFWYFGASQAI